MEQGFIDILKKLITEQGKDSLFNESKCKSLLADYTKGEHKKESRFLMQAIEAGVPKEIDDAKDVRECKKRQVKLLNEEYILDEKVATDVVNTLALVLRGDTGQEAQAALDRGNNHHENRDYDKAIAEFNEAIKIDPDFAKAYRCRGLSYMAKGQHSQVVDKAIADFNKAINLDPNVAWPYVKRGLIHKHRGQLDEAIRDCSKAIDLDPNNAEAYGIRGETYQSKGLLEKATDDLSKSIELNPGDTTNEAISYMSLAGIYKETGQKSKAIKAYEKALSLNVFDGPGKAHFEGVLRQLRGY